MSLENSNFVLSVDGGIFLKIIDGTLTVKMSDIPLWMRIVKGKQGEWQ
jgi:hypothetical protein